MLQTSQAAEINISGNRFNILHRLNVRFGTHTTELSHSFPFHHVAGIPSSIKTQYHGTLYEINLGSYFVWWHLGPLLFLYGGRLAENFI